ncbi:tail completion or Neck1 protein [Salmonella phage 36]|uniref:Uncharacterized protein n=1 Tax=Salmonella phage 36 TaxID=1654889 RepID=A0A0N7CFC2_9CAUD|nr:tail completion or Neck1 protein [Salmonella phage 36]AKJ74000.1 hypothetical protein SP36_28 [Salmonella phage 36]
MADYSIREFHGNVDKWIEQVESGLNDVIQIFGEKVHGALVDIAPVDTGRFKANMQITANKPPLYALNQYDPDGEKTKAEGRRTLYALLHGGGAIKSIYFSNMLIYANALEYGHSKQAPAGVFGIVAIRLRSYMAEAIREARKKMHYELSVAARMALAQEYESEYMIAYENVNLRHQKAEAFGLNMTTKKQIQ